MDIVVACASALQLFQRRRAGRARGPVGADAPGRSTATPVVHQLSISL